MESPRYEAMGKWHHADSYSSWKSENTWRPLPRREFSVRDDYHVLSGTNRHTITPTGWIQGEDNLKLILNDAGLPCAVTPYLAREAGLNRYERIIGHDFSAGNDYWEKTALFWADVRHAWQAVYERRDTFTLKPVVDDKHMFDVLFTYADNLDDREQYDSAAGRIFIDTTLQQFIE